MPELGQDLLVTGTDTGVGKTVIACALVLALRARGTRVVGFKPVETGLTDGERSDSELLAQASGIDEPLAAPLLRLTEPLAPAVAAERAGTTLDPSEVIHRVRALRRAGYRLVVEGAGGVATPLAWGFTVLDLAAECGLAAVVVARAGLGTLNHTWLTVAALRSRGIAVRDIVLNGGANLDLAESTNPEAIARLLPEIPCLLVPRSHATDPLAVARDAATIVDAVARNTPHL